ncbi:MAG: uroporphyrinogen-III C-methyltransferase [Chloroflexi bacterium]|nr:uroporphyrinogen-III C-methyltransferase [Chloroflexota bacterium]
MGNQPSVGVGKVYLVGAGPGDPDLITVKGLRLLRQADVVVYDRLIPMELLKETRPDAELIYAGKQPQKHRLDQSEINHILIDRASKGCRVVRLKGGDPFVFGRGGEEGLACYAANIPFEVVPGVSSAIAVPAYAGIPVTHRHVASAFTVFTGHDDPTKETKEGNSIDYPALAAAVRLGTLVLMMGVNHLDPICRELIQQGISADTPAVCIEWGTTANQRTMEGTLESIAYRVTEAGLSSPAITVMGEVTRLRHIGLDWFQGSDDKSKI